MFFRLIPWLLILCAPVVLLVPRIFREIVKAGLKYKLRVDGADVDSAVCTFSTESLGRLIIEISGITIENPEGFEATHLASVGSVKVSVSPWGIFLKFWTLDYVTVEDVEVWIEQKQGLGINAEVLRTKMNAGRIEKADQKLTMDEEEEHDPDAILSMLGLVSVDSASMAADHAFHMLDAAKGMLAEKLDKASNKVQDAGGIHKFLAAGISGLGSALRDASKKAGEKVKEGGKAFKDGGAFEAAKGAAAGLSKEMGEKIGHAADKAEHSLLQQMLHRKIVGCYEELQRDTRLSCGRFSIVGLKMHTRGLLEEKTRQQHPELGEMSVSEVLLEPQDLVPHVKAVLQTCLPLREFLRRLKVMLSYKMRIENRKSIVAFASAGVKERVLPHFLVPKDGQNAAEFVKGAADGAGGAVNETVKKTPKVLTKAGSVAKKIFERAAGHEAVKRVDGAQELMAGAGTLAENTGELAAEVVGKTHKAAEHTIKEANKVLEGLGGIFANVTAKKPADSIKAKAKVLHQGQVLSGRGSGSSGEADEIGGRSVLVEGEDEAVLVESVKDKDA